MPESVALWFLFFAYTAVFGILFGFVGRAHRRTEDLEEEIKRLKEALDAREEGEKTS